MSCSATLLTLTYVRKGFAIVCLNTCLRLQSYEASLERLWCVRVHHHLLLGIWVGGPRIRKGVLADPVLVVTPTGPEPLADGLVSELIERVVWCPSSVTILSQASSNSNEVVSHPGRHGRSHIWPGEGIAFPSGN